MAWWQGTLPDEWGRDGAFPALRLMAFDLNWRVTGPMPEVWGSSPGSMRKLEVITVAYVPHPFKYVLVWRLADLACGGVFVGGPVAACAWPLVFILHVSEMLFCDCKLCGVISRMNHMLTSSKAV